MAILSKSEYLSSINSLLPDNSTQQISPADVRESLVNLIDSVHNFLDDRKINTQNFSSPDIRTTRGGDLALGKLGLVHRHSYDNTAYGYYALGGNYQSSGNTALGSSALGCNLQGDHNVAVGMNAIAGNVLGSGNIGVGNFSLQSTRNGSMNIAIGHGAGHYIGQNSSHKFYLGSHDGFDTDHICGVLPNSGDPPLLYGDLLNKKLAIGLKNLHNFGVLQVSGDITPNAQESHNLGNTNRRFHSVNEDIYFSGGAVSINTASPSGQGALTVAGNLVPHESEKYSLGYVSGSDKLLWDGYFNDVVISGQLHANDVNYNNINECLYDCKTLHLATSGLCDEAGLGFHNDGVCGYLSDESLDGAGFETHSSGVDYQRDYKFIFRSPNANLTCLEYDDSKFNNHYARASWQSNISIHIESGRHLQTDRVLGIDRLSLAMQSGCYGWFMNTFEPSGQRSFLTNHPQASAQYPTVEDVNFIGRSGTHLGSDSNPVGYDYTLMYGSVDSGVKIAHKFASRIKTSAGARGFSIVYHDVVNDPDPGFDSGLE